MRDPDTSETYIHGLCVFIIFVNNYNLQMFDNITGCGRHQNTPVFTTIYIVSINISRQNRKVRSNRHLTLKHIWKKTYFDCPGSYMILP